MKRILRNKLKNNRLLRNLYRNYKQRPIKNKLLSEVKQLKSISKTDFDSQQQAYFKSMAVEDSERNRGHVANQGIGIYFKSETASNGITLTDHFKGAPYHSRQRMLVTAYNYLGLGQLKDYSLADLAGSCGYYSFLASSFGFKEITVLEGRKEYEGQYEMLREKLPENPVVWKQKDVTKGIDVFDVVLCQGLLYHLYDHLDFLTMLYEKTNKCLILETELSGHPGFLNLSKFEDVADNRQGLAGIALYPSYLTVISLLKTAGFKKITRVAPPTDVGDYHGYNKNRRTMLLCEK